MRKALGTFAALVLAGQSCLAADIFVRDAKGDDLSRAQIGEVTDLVRKAVQNMPEHTLVKGETEADFVLQPTVVNRGDQMALRIEKLKDGDLLAMAEEPIRSVSASSERASSLTETAMADDIFVSSSDSPSVSEAPTATLDESSGATMSEEEVSPERSIASQDSGSYQDESAMSSSSGMSSSASDESANIEAQDTESGASTAQSDQQMGPSVGEVAAPSPRLQDPNRRGFFAIGVGPAFGLGLESDEVMYNVNASYNRNFGERLTGKIFSDLNLGSGAEAARFINIGLGADVYPTMQSYGGGRPYVTADVGYAFTRNSEETTKDAPAIGAGAGFRFQAAELNFDVNVHYSILTSQIEGDNPSVLGLRLAVNF